MKAFGLRDVGLLKRQNLEVYKAVHPSPKQRPALRFTLRGARERARPQARNRPSSRCDA